MQSNNQTLTPKTALEKAANIAYKYRTKYTKNKLRGEIKYDVVSVDRTRKDNHLELEQVAKKIKTIQGQLKPQERRVIFLGCKASSHTKSIIITKDYVFINRNDKISPYIEDVLNKDERLKVVLISPLLEKGNQIAFIQQDTGCATVAGKLAKHIATLSDQDLKKIVTSKKKGEVLEKKRRPSNRFRRF
jgi:hypothetical protein